SKELVIGSNRHETKVAILEDDQLVEVYFQRANEYSLAGSIHKGRVTRVLPGMQSAFVDLGLERDTFLYVSDFFEEHEDIDTVADEKPSRGDRRDRGHRERGGERQAEERETRAPVIEIAPPEAAEVAEGEEGIPAAGVAAEPNTNPEGDRGFRGDRRGRRSRRRRQRGRGFPENKYAQPSDLGARQPEAASAPAEEEGETAPEDVIILPGESLAKYRNVSAGSETPEESDEPAVQERERQAAEEEAIEAEADEIELAEKVFSHHDDESVPEVEEKIEEVKEDQPAPPEAESASLVESTPGPVEARPVDVGIAEDAEAPDSEALGIEEFETLDSEEALPPVDEAFDERAQPVAEEAVETETPVEAEAEDASRPQTASVREQGGRYMHRVSRRMRRRRGGSRWAQQSDFGAGESAGGGAGAAAAVQPESRAETRRDAQEERSAEKPERQYPSISDLLKPGQEIIVQIAKEPLGQKGARITSHIALPGRYVVYMPSVNHLGVSRKVSSEEERQRLKRILQAHRVGTTGGFIVRTAGEGVPEDEIAADMNFLYSLWLDIRQKAEKRPAPALLHHDLDIVERVLRDQVTEDFKSIWVDSEEMYENVLTFMQRFQPALVNRVKMYTRTAPIFDAFGITQELEKALRPKVWLKSGGYIVINQTEALVAIDINTGKYVGKSNRLEDTIVKTNTEAVKEIVRQIRLRDLGGIIVVDFIDMDERKNRQKVMQALEEAMRADRAPYKILQFNDFGLVAITRKRVKQSLERTLCSPCPYCEGAGYVKSVQTVIGEILVEAQKIAKAIDSKDVLLRVHPDVAKELKASNNQFLEELEEILKRPVLVKGDPTLHHEKFDLA
ncbi:MAG TPA: Rne/Rng family ribonuclease, partial [Terriglobales bacterium]|nr:Rne/Rng family ribonuclease [Terriglobales bacterium]